VPPEIVIAVLCPTTLIVAVLEGKFVNANTTPPIGFELPKSKTMLAVVLVLDLQTRLFVSDRKLAVLVPLAGVVLVIVVVDKST
jgi:hypothetical protein